MIVANLELTAEEVSINIDAVKDAIKAKEADAAEAERWLGADNVKTVGHLAYLTTLRSLQKKLAELSY